MMDVAPHAMNLQILFEGIESMPPDVEVTDITTHAQHARPGGLFLACAGARAHVGVPYTGDCHPRQRAAVAARLGGRCSFEVSELWVKTRPGASATEKRCRVDFLPTTLEPGIGRGDEGRL